MFSAQGKTLLRRKRVCFWLPSRENFPVHGQSLRHTGGQILKIRFKIFSQWACCLRRFKHALFNNVPFDSCDLNICSDQQSFDPCFVPSWGLISLGYFSLELGESWDRAALGSVEREPGWPAISNNSRVFMMFMWPSSHRSDQRQKASFKRLLWPDNQGRFFFFKQ